MSDFVEKEGEGAVWKRKLKLRWWWIAVAVLAVAVLILFLIKKPDEKVDPVESPSVPVVTRVVEEVPVSDPVVLPAVVRADSVVTVSTEKAGRVMDILVEKGDPVSAGDVLMRLDDRIWKTVAERAEIEFTNADREYTRWQELKAKGAVSESDYDAIAQRRDMARAGSEEARVLLSQCEVRSPVDGVVDARFAEPGEYMNEGVPVFRVVKLHPVRISFNIPERDVAVVATGDSAVFETGSGDAEVFEGAVNFISVSAGVQSKSFSAEMRLDGSCEWLRDGMVGRVTLERQTGRTGILVPLAAVIPQKSDQIVFLLENGHAVRRVVRIGGFTGADAIISRGLEPGERIIVEGHRALQDGDAVYEAGADEAAPVPAEDNAAAGEHE